MVEQFEEKTQDKFHAFKHKGHEVHKGKDPKAFLRDLCVLGG
jgi:hypothetical protein